MRRYETIFITDPELPDEEVNGLVASLSTTVTDRKGEVLKNEDWGRKKLAYDVQKRREGRYLRLEYSAPDGALPTELERRMRLAEPVIKFLTVRIDNDKKRLVWEEKQAVKEQERAARQALAAEQEGESKADESKAEEGRADESQADESTSAASKAGDSGSGERED